MKSISWFEEKNNLKIRIEKGHPSPTNVEELSILEIEIIDSVFQHRSGNAAGSGKHSENLIKSLKKQKWKRFDPLTVYWVGDGLVIVDGHHRYEGYKEQKIHDPVPVRVFNGSLDEAINEALKGNSKDKLAMSPREKSEAAWRLVTGTALRTFQIVESSTRSKPTILKMRSIKANLGKQNPSLDFAGLSWENAQRLHKGQALVTKKIDHEWFNREVSKQLERFIRTFGTHFRTQPDILWAMLDRYDSRLIGDLLKTYDVDLEELEASRDF